MKSTRSWFGLVCVALLVACGGGGGGGGGGNPNPTPAPAPAPVIPDRAVGGIYEGTITGCSKGCPYEAIMLVAEDGEYLIQDPRFISAAAIGEILVDGGSIEGSRNTYLSSDDFKSFGTPPTQPSLVATENDKKSIVGFVVERQSIEFEYVRLVPTGGKLVADYDVQYDEDSSLAKISGMYSADDGAGYALTYVIDAMGGITGSDSTGCTISGNVEIIDPEYNMYRTDFAFSACGVDGADGNGYTGLAALLTDSTTGQESLLFHAATATDLVSLWLPRI